MVAAFPLAKIAAIFIKQASKPLATAVKTRAKKSSFFRNYICMPPAQFYHRCEVRVKMWSMNLGKPVNIPKLNETQAIDFGAELIGEAVIFGVATLVLVAEYIRSSRKESAKEEVRKQEILQMQADLKDLYMKNASLEAQVRELVRIHKVNVPGSIFSPAGHSEDDIPSHLRTKAEDTASTGIFSSMYALVWDAVEQVLPKSDNSTQESSQKGATGVPTTGASPEQNSQGASSQNSKNTDSSKSNNNSGSKH